jgi:hypothetical protein
VSERNGATLSVRRQAIVRLLETRDEHLPEPTRRADGVAGFVHRAKVPVTCADCLANDGRGNRFDCETCGGSGFVEEFRERDPYAQNDVKAYGLDGSRHDSARERDRQIGVLEQQIRSAASVDELADANDHPYGWELARRRMWKLYDYGALDAALEQLRVADDGASRALHAVYVYAWQPKASTGPLQVACERGLAFLDERLPQKLRAPGAEPEARVRGPLQRGAGVGVRELRDADMRARAEAGASLADLAAEFRVSIRTVYRVVSEAA